MVSETILLESQPPIVPFYLIINIVSFAKISPSHFAAPIFVL